MLKYVWSGKYDSKELEEGADILKSELVKFNKGEVLYLCDGSNIDMRIMSNDQAKIFKEFAAFGVPYCKKIAFIQKSFMHQRSQESTIGQLSNFKYFASVQEAMKWLLD